MYSIEGLENGINGARANIASLESAIDKERNTIKDYRIMIDDIERADKKLKEAYASVNVEVVRD